MLPMLLYLVAVRANAGGATKCVDRIIDSVRAPRPDPTDFSLTPSLVFQFDHQEYKLHSQGLSTTMAWRSSDGNSCEDYEKLLYCDGTSTAGNDWTAFGADGMDASQACCACGGGDMVSVSATPAPTSTVNTLGTKHPGKSGNSYCTDMGPGGDKSRDMNTKDATSMEWVNDYGQSCDEYELSQVCSEDGGIGFGYEVHKYEFPELEETQYDGLTALEACCVCGGGNKVTYPPSFQPTSAPTKEPTVKPTRAPSKEVLTLDDEVTYQSGLVRSFYDPMRDDDALFDPNSEREREIDDAAGGSSSSSSYSSFSIDDEPSFDDDDESSYATAARTELQLWTLSDAHAKVFADAFEHLDLDKNGYLSEAELKKEATLTSAEIENGLLITKVDHLMDFAEFSAWRQATILPPAPPPAPAA